MSIKMDFGYCENAVEYDRLSSFRKSLALRGFSHEDVGKRSEVEELEVFGDDKTEPMERLVAYGMCPDRCDRCLEAHQTYRSSKWFGRANEACKAAIDKDMSPFFVTLVFPDLAYPLPVREDMRERKVIRQELYDKREKQAREQIEKDMTERVYSPDFRIDDVIHYRASIYADKNLESQMQIRHSKPCLRLSRESNLSPFKALNRRQLKRIAKARPDEPIAFYIDALKSDGENYKLGAAVRHAKSIENPTYGYVRHSFQRWVKRLRFGSRGYPAYKLSFLAFPEQGSKGSQRYHYHMVLFVEGGFPSKAEQTEFKECCRMHWHEVSGNTRFPDKPDRDPEKSELWFDVTRDSKQVAAYVSKYVSKETLEGERVLSSKGFNWTQAVRDAALARRGLLDTPPAAYDWTDGMQYQSPVDDDAVPSSSHWVGFDVERYNSEPNVRIDRRGERHVEQRSKPATFLLPENYVPPKVSLIAYAITREPVNHPAQATRISVSSGCKVNEDTVSNYTWYPYEAVADYLRLSSGDISDIPRLAAVSEFFDSFLDAERNLRHAVESVRYTPHMLVGGKTNFLGFDVSSLTENELNERFREAYQAFIDLRVERIESNEVMITKLAEFSNELEKKRIY